MRDWLSESDSRFDPQAYVLRPDVVIDISRKIIEEDTPFRRSKVAAFAAIDTLRRAIEGKKVHIDEREAVWLDTMEGQLEEVPDDEEQFIAEMLERDTSGKLDPSKYDL
jgi:methanol--5-hydroxybenzimidazolylcobamide Co-methyltransferase